MNIKDYPFYYFKTKTAAVLILKILNGLIPTVQVMATGAFLDRCIFYLTERQGLARLSQALVMLLVVMALDWTLAKIIDLTLVELELGLYGKSRELILEKNIRMKYWLLEDKENYERIQRMMRNPETLWQSSFLAVCDSIALVVRIVSLLLFIGANAPWSAVVMTASMLPMAFSAFKGGKKIYDNSVEAQIWQNKSEYSYELLTDKKSAHERSLFGYFDMVRKQWAENYEKYTGIQMAGEKSFHIQYLKTGVMIVAAAFVSILLLLPPLQNGTMTEGVFISLAGSMVTLLRSINSGMNRCSRECGKAATFLRDYRKFLDLEERKMNVNDSAEFQRIEIRDLSFRYPNTDTYVLKGVNMTLERGKHYSLLGVNGAGKSTLMKILCGLYTDYEGTILVDGKRDFAEVQDNVRAVFQDFARYQLSVKDNICLGLPMDDQRFWEIIKLLELDSFISGLPQKEDTPLGKIYEGGQDLSGGQWQKLAMARLLYQEKLFYILDEPTAALDPISESRLYERFETIANGKTVIFISHRLASVHLTEQIFVLDGGKIAEEGSFDELMSRKGIFCQMYREQERWYHYHG